MAAFLCDLPFVRHSFGVLQIMFALRLVFYRLEVIFTFNFAIDFRVGRKVDNQWLKIAPRSILGSVSWIWGLNCVLIMYYCRKSRNCVISEEYNAKRAFEPSKIFDFAVLYSYNFHDFQEPFLEGIFGGPNRQG